jgi:hypothetical protein
MNYLKIILLSGFSAALISCSSHKETLSEEQLNEGDRVYYFYNRYADEREILTAEPILHLEKPSYNVVFDSLLRRLSDNYSSGQSGMPEGKVNFSLQGIHTIKTDAKDYKIAVINIDDPANIMERRFFQGSSGGKNTQDNILMTVLQPQLEGFLDGVIVHLNGAPVGLLDHVNFQGIKNSADYSYEAENAIR